MPIANGSSEQGPAKSLLDEEPCQQRTGDGCRNRMRKRHVGEVNVRNAAHGGFSRRALDAEVIETDPRQLHRLNSEEHRSQRNRRKAPLDQKCGGGMVDSEHMACNLGPVKKWPRD